MGDIIPFERKEQANPHATGEAQCLDCGQEWVAVVPVGTLQLECPSCHTMRGTFRYPFSPADGVSRRECSCGCQLFYVMPDAVMCYRCGLEWEHIVR